MQKIKSNGCTFYYNDNPSCYDIDVELGTETITFGSEGKLCTIELLDCRKVFHDVKTLVINKGVMIITIPNRMFPNVRKVVSHNTRFLNSKYLISRKYYLSDARPDTLLNSFCLKPDEVLDLKDIKYIMPEALDGCETLKITNTEEISELSGSTFAGSAIANQMAPKGGCLTAGTLLLKVDETAKALEFPPETTRISTNINLDDIKELKIHSLKIMYSIKAIPETVIFGKEIDGTNINVLYSATPWKSIKEFKVDEDNAWFTAKDGILYDKNMQTLIRYPGKRNGRCKVPDGVKKINEHAFASSAVEEIICPDSLKEIGQYAFTNCKNLRYIDFGAGIKNIGDKRFDSSFFSGCASLKHVTIPEQVRTIGQNAFEGSGLEQVTLNEGLTYIGMSAFADTNIQEIEIPSTVKHTSYGALADIKKVRLKTKSERLPAGFLGSLISYKNEWPDDGVEVCIGNEIVYFFRPNRYASTKNIQTVEQLKVFAKKRANVFADVLIEKDEDENLAKLLDMGYLEPDDFGRLLDAAHEKNNPVIVAMLLDKAKELKKENVKLEMSDSPRLKAGACFDERK